MRILVSPVVALTAILAGCGDHVPRGPARHEAQSMDLDKSEMLRVELNLGVGELYLTGGSPKLLEADFTYEDPFGKPLMDYHASSFRGAPRISQPRGIHGGIHGGDYKWDLRLNNSRATDLVAHLGVGEVHMEAGSLNLRSLEIHMGVGEMNLDLRGTPKRSFDVQIHGGVGEAVGHLPRTVGIQARATGGIGDISLQGLKNPAAHCYNPSHHHH